MTTWVNPDVMPVGVIPDDWPSEGDHVEILKGPCAGKRAVVIGEMTSAMYRGTLRLRVLISKDRADLYGAVPDEGLLRKVHPPVLHGFKTWWGRCRDCTGRLWPWRRWAKNPELCASCEKWIKGLRR